MSAAARSMIRASLAMIGTIIGAGLFGLPAAFSRAGFVPATILFFFLAAVVTLTHLLYAEQLLAVHGRIRLSGLARQGLGELAFHVTSITYPLQIIGANFAYLILGGEFLAVLARAAHFDVPVAAWQLAFWVGGALTVLFGLRAVIRIESILTPAKMLVLLVAVALAWPSVDTALASTAAWHNWHLPFGIFLFSLSGMSGVGEVIEIAGRRRRESLIAVAGGSLVSALLCWLFGAAIFLAARGYPIRGAADIVSVLPPGASLIIPLLGFLAVATAYLMTSEDLRETFTRDFKWKPAIATAVALFAPVSLLAILSRDFLSSIGFVGAVFVGMNGLTVCALGYKAMFNRRDHFAHVVGTAMCALLIGVYVFGMVQQIFSRQSL